MGRIHNLISIDVLISCVGHARVSSSLNILQKHYFQIPIFVDKPAL